MRIKKYSELILVIALLLPLSCSDPYNHEIDEAALDYTHNDHFSDAELDSWIVENFVNPYNIEVKYRWEANESNFNNQLTPSDPANVQSIMNVAKAAWIEPYVDQAGEDFFKRFTPKQFVLVGSPNYNPGGTITLGTAEGGRKVVLFSVNEFEDDDRAKIKEQMHTVHHEFAHILHQTIPYPAEFKEITKGAYTADWFNIPPATAQSRGFITSYAMSGPDEDFVEIIAKMLTEGKRGFDRIVCAIPDQTAQGYIREKESFVVNYYADVYKVDFYELQEKTDAAIDAFAPKSILSDLGFGQGQNFYGIRIDPSEVPGMPAGFVNIYNASKANMQAQNLNLDYVLIAFVGDDQIVVQFAYTDNDGTEFYANIWYSMNILDINVVELTRLELNPSAQSILTYVDPLIKYFETNTLRFDYIPYDTDDCVYDYGGIFPEGKPDQNSFGILVN